MLRNVSENLFPDRASNSETRGPGANKRAREQGAESQMLMERKVSLQTFNHTNEHRLGLASSVLLTFFGHIAGGLSALGRRFMNALCESRLRQANRVIEQYRHLADRAND